MDTGSVEKCVPCRESWSDHEGSGFPQGWSSAEWRLLERRDHRERVAALVVGREAVTLVEADRRRALLDAERELLVAGVAGPRDELFEQLLADAVLAAGGHDGDRELWRVLVHEAPPGRFRREEPVPRRPDRMPALERDHGSVPGPAPTLDVARDGDLGVVELVDVPVVGVPEHRAQEGHVLLAAGADHCDEWSSCASCKRFPSGSKTSRIRICPCSSTTTPTCTPSSRSRSASPFTSS